MNSTYAIGDRVWYVGEEQDLALGSHAGSKRAEEDSLCEHLVGGWKYMVKVASRDESKDERMCER